MNNFLFNISNIIENTMSQGECKVCSANACILQEELTKEEK
jgi:hypothetical protein